METTATITGYICWIYRDNGNEHGTTAIMIWYTWGISRDNGKEHGNYNGKDNGNYYITMG